MLHKFGKRAQTTAEYAILIALVVAAVTAMQIYVKRGIQGKVKDVVDNMGTGMGLTTNTKQYEPYYLTSVADTQQHSSDREDVATGGSVIRTNSGGTDATRTQDIGWNGQP